MEIPNVAWHVFFDALCLIMFALPPFVYNLLEAPPTTQRGFFCNDESIRYPYHDSTVPSYLNITMAVVIMFVLAVLVEIYSWKSSSETKSSWKEHRSVLYEVYRAMGYFFVGASMNQFLTDLCKFSIGRLRPHFFEVCQPNVTCTDANKYDYIENFECLRTSHPLISDQKFARALDEVRLSFPSGHSSLAMYGCIYLSGYLEFRLRPHQFWRLLRHLIQLGLVAWGVYVCCSRVFDYKHHPTDVLAGMALGILVALFAVYMYVWSFNLSRMKKFKKLHPNESPDPYDLRPKEESNLRDHDLAMDGGAQDNNP